jgi:hypothetical protein
MKERELPTSRQSARRNDYCTTPTQCTSFLLKFVLVVGASIRLEPWPSPGPLVSGRAGTPVVTGGRLSPGGDESAPIKAVPIDLSRGTSARDAFKVIGLAEINCEPALRFGLLTGRPQIPAKPTPAPLPKREYLGLPSTSHYSCTARPTVHCSLDCTRSKPSQKTENMTASACGSGASNWCRSQDFRFTRTNRRRRGHH